GRRYLSNGMPPMPSEPAATPTSRNASATGTPSFADARLIETDSVSSRPKPARTSADVRGSAEFTPRKLCRHEPLVVIPNEERDLHVIRCRSLALLGMTISIAADHRPHGIRCRSLALLGMT